MAKRTYLIVAIVMLIVFLTGCGAAPGGNAPTEGPTPSATTTPTATPTPTPTPTPTATPTADDITIQLNYVGTNPLNASHPILLVVLTNQGTPATLTYTKASQNGIYRISKSSFSPSYNPSGTYYLVLVHDLDGNGDADGFDPAGYYVNNGINNFINASITKGIESISPVQIGITYCITFDNSADSGIGLVIF